MIGRPAFAPQFFDFAPALANDEGADNRADCSDDGGRAAQLNQESAAANSSGRCVGRRA